MLKRLMLVSTLTLLALLIGADGARSASAGTGRKTTKRRRSSGRGSSRCRRDNARSSREPRGARGRHRAHDDQVPGRQRAWR